METVSGAGLRAGHDLDQRDQVGRIEVMRHQQPSAVREDLGQPAGHEARGVAGEDRLLSADWLEGSEERVLRLEILDDRLDDQLRIPETACPRSVPPLIRPEQGSS